MHAAQTSEHRRDLIAREHRRQMRGRARALDVLEPREVALEHLPVEEEDLWAGVFLLSAKLVPALTLHPLVSGIVFGVFVFLAMRLVVLPLSAFPYPVAFKPLATVLDLLSHTLLFGVPIAWAIQRTLRNVPVKA